MRYSSSILIIAVFFFWDLSWRIALELDVPKRFCSAVARSRWPEDVRIDEGGG
jgi:hypothetical protein